MDKKGTLKDYFLNLENKSYEGIIQLFAPHACVFSPLYGQVEASRFYRELFLDTQSSKITLKNLFVNPDNTDCAAVHFVYAWVMKDGSVNQFECVDVFQFVPNSLKIKSLTIIYDTYHTRKNFEKLHQS